MTATPTVDPMAQRDRVNLIALHAVTGHAVEHQLGGLIGADVTIIGGGVPHIHVNDRHVAGWLATIHVDDHRHHGTSSDGRYVRHVYDCRLPDGTRFELRSWSPLLAVLGGVR